MSATVCLAVSWAFDYRSTGAGNLWAYLNWALGLRALGHRVVWLEFIDATKDDGLEPRIRDALAVFDRHGVTLALATLDGSPLPAAVGRLCAGLDAALSADLVLNFIYALDADVLRRFRRTALVDIDPGLLQIWMTEGQIEVARHDHYFTIGEWIGDQRSCCPDAGVSWHHAPPPVFLGEWPPTHAPAGAAYTTVSNWWGQWVKWGEESYPNDKRTAFLEFTDLPRRTPVPLELALGLHPVECDERQMLESKGFRVGLTWDLCATPDDYRRYIQQSRGEWSCAKPAYVKLANAWISDRTVCYLASGKPAVVQHTGPSRFLPDACGLWRFRDLEGAVRCLEAAEADYEAQCREARALAEEYFDARVVIGRVLELALG